MKIKRAHDQKWYEWLWPWKYTYGSDESPKDNYVAYCWLAWEFQFFKRGKM
jgi:hypothetical protein